MRSSDQATLARVLLSLVIVYLVIVRANPYITIALIAIAFITDGIDGYLAVREASHGSVGFLTYLKSAFGNAKAQSAVRTIKESISQTAPYGARIDVAGDRVIEYSFWILFTYLRIIPLFLFLFVMIRHAFADALMGSHGTSSKMKTRFAKAVYSSNVSRATVNILKFAAFSYLVLMYVSNYPHIVGYLLVAALFAMIMLRGAAEIYESLPPPRTGGMGRVKTKQKSRG